MSTEQISTTSGNLMQICATGEEQRYADKGKIRASSLTKYNLSKYVMHSITNDAERIYYNYPSIFKTTDDRVYTFGTKLNSKEIDGLNIKYIQFDKYDSEPFNFELIVFIGGIYVTAVSNEVLDKQCVKLVSREIDSSMARYRIELPFDKMFVNQEGLPDDKSMVHSYVNGNASVNNGIQLLMSKLNTQSLEVKLITTNKVANINLICETVYIENRKLMYEKDYTINIMRPEYTHGLSNSLIEITNKGYCMGYYIHCEKPITNIKMIIWNKIKHDLDADLIDVMCERVNSYTLYLPISANTKRYAYDINSIFCHLRVDKLEFMITTESSCPVPVCIVSESYEKYTLENTNKANEFKIIRRMDLVYTYKDLLFRKNHKYESNKIVYRPLISDTQADAATNNTLDNTCIISHEPIVRGDEYVKCGQCIALVKYDVMVCWWTRNKSCPHCRVTIPELIKYVNTDSGMDILPVAIPPVI